MCCTGVGIVSYSEHIKNNICTSEEAERRYIRLACIASTRRACQAAEEGLIVSNGRETSQEDILTDVHMQPAGFIYGTYIG